MTLENQPSYTDYVFAVPFDQQGHSGVRSPAISLDPRYSGTVLPIQRLNALYALEQYACDFEVARRAIEWCATWEIKPYIQEEAQDMLARLGMIVS